MEPAALFLVALPHRGSGPVDEDISHSSTQLVNLAKFLALQLIYFQFRHLDQCLDFGENINFHVGREQHTQRLGMLATREAARLVLGRAVLFAEFRRTVEREQYIVGLQLVEALGQTSLQPENRR